MSNLFRRSVEIILENQDESGGYIASPNFSSYKYCWFRDGAFTAYAMNLVGKHESAGKFHQWAANNILSRKSIVNRAIEKAEKGMPLKEADILHTRYSLNGTVSDEEWPNFQLDGFGTWLWALSQHKEMSKFELSSDVQIAANLIGQYLSTIWKLPCYDCWEEFPDKIHPSTLAAIYAGLSAKIDGLYGCYDLQLGEIETFLKSNGIINGRLCKFIGSKDVDSNLIGVSVPYKLLLPNDPIMLETIDKIEEDLVHDGGVHRYSADTYYGGGEWVLLTAWLGWYYTEIGEIKKAKHALSWVEKQFDEEYHLPEQIPNSLNEESYYQYWIDRWGEIASPLLWSHAQYIILYLALNGEQHP